MDPAASVSDVTLLSTPEEGLDGGFGLLLDALGVILASVRRLLLPLLLVWAWVLRFTMRVVRESEAIRGEKKFLPRFLSSIGDVIQQSLRVQGRLRPIGDCMRLFRSPVGDVRKLFRRS